MTKMNIGKNLLIAITSAALFAGAIIAIPVIANAQNGSSEKRIISEENEVGFNDRTEISELRKGDSHKDGRGRDLLGAVMEDLGIEKADIATGIKNGATLAEVAESNGISSDDLISTITSIMTEKLNEAVAEGKITADEALAKADNIQERAQQMVNKPLEQKPGKGHNHRGEKTRLLGAVMEDLGIEKADIATGIRNGATLAEVAESNGISSDDLISTITSIMTEKLNEAVTEGKITADEALAKADNIQERAQQMVNKPLEQKPGKGHNHRGEKTRLLSQPIL